MGVLCTGTLRTAGLSELEVFTYLLTIPPHPRKSQFLIMQQSLLVTCPAFGMPTSGPEIVLVGIFLRVVDFVQLQYPGQLQPKNWGLVRDC